MKRILLATALTMTAGAAYACPQITEGVQSHSVTGEQLYSPRTYSVTAGGDVDLGACGSAPGTGYIISQPDFSFYTSGMGGYDRLEIEVSSPGCDTVLLVNSANGSWFFDDDSNGDLQPVVNLQGTQNTEGRVDVWVGTYNGDYCSASLEMETW